MRPLVHARVSTPFSFPIAEPSALVDDGRGAGGEREGGGAAVEGTCTCGCPCCSNVWRWQRSLKRKLEGSDGRTRFISCGSVADGVEGPRADIDNEAAALREALASREATIQKLLWELEEERKASSSAAMAAVSMIARLQQEKAEAQMEARQFERVVDEKMAHDQQELASLEDLLFKRNHAVQALSWEVQAYRHRLLSYGIGADGKMPPSEPQTPDTATSTSTAAANPFDAAPQFDPYPPLRCPDVSSTDLNLNASAETPREYVNLFKPRVSLVERTRTSSPRSSKNRGVVVRQSPRRRQADHRSFSYASIGSFNKEDGCPEAAECSPECDGADDRVYTVDAVHGAGEETVSTPKEVHSRGGGEKDNEAEKEAEIRKLFLKLQALEANKESMRQTLLSMSTDKAQMALLKDIAQQMCKAAAADKKVVRKQASFKKPSLMSMCKSIVSVVLWKKRSCRVRYTFGLSSSNTGLVLLLDKSSPRLRPRKLLTRAAQS